MSSDSLGAKYLEEPARLPRRSEAEPFGARQLPLDIGGKRFDVSGLSDRQAGAIRERWPEFVREGRAAATPLSINRVPETTFKKLDRWVYELDFDYRDDAISMVGLDLIAHIQLAPALDGALWVHTEEPDTFPAAFENFLRVVTAYAALDGGGALIHSAAVAENDDTWLFTGHSGAGKSTVSRLGADSGRLVLSDDLNPILPSNADRIDIVGSPFLGDLGSRTNVRRPLSAIYRLEQGPEAFLRPMGRAETLASLMACAPYVNFDPLRSGALATNLIELSRRVPAHVLTFRRDDTLWPLLERSAHARS